MDELFEALTLIQTGKVQNFPVILFGSAFWGGLLQWLRATLLAEGKVSQHDLDLLVVSDSPEEVRDLILGTMHEQPWRADQEAGARADTRDALSSSQSTNTQQ
jgi:hypothetical protein